MPRRPKRPTREERNREALARTSRARMVRLKAEPAPSPFIPGDTAGEHRPGDLYALYFRHDLEEHVAVVGEVLGHGFSAYPVIAIYRGDPYRILTFDVYRRGEILVGPGSVLTEVEFGAT